jgi:hypothetical protein
MTTSAMGMSRARYVTDTTDVLNVWMITTFRQLPRDGSSKTVFMGHQRWLAEDDKWRTRADLFDGTEETRGPPRQRIDGEIKQSYIY